MITYRPFVKAMVVYSLAVSAILMVAFTTWA